MDPFFGVGSGFTGSVAAGPPCRAVRTVASEFFFFWGGYRLFLVGLFLLRLSSFDVVLEEGMAG